MAEKENGDSSKKRAERYSFVSALLAGIASLVMAFNTYLVSQFESDFKKIQSERELNFRIYQSIADALETDESRRPQRIRAVRAIVNAMASEEVREAFINALEVGEVQVFEREEGAIQVSAAANTADSWLDWNYDVFWCSSSGPRAEAQAETVMARLRKDGLRGELRLRVLPDSVNDRQGYRIDGYEVRYEDGELAQAESIGQLAEEVLGIAFRLQQAFPKKKTPSHVAVFVCPEEDEGSG